MIAKLIGLSRLHALVVWSGVFCLGMGSQQVDASDHTKLHHQLLVHMNHHRQTHGRLPPATALQERRSWNERAQSLAQHLANRMLAAKFFWDPSMESSACLLAGTSNNKHLPHHCEKNVFLVSNPDALSLFRRSMKQGSFRRRLEWIGFNESGLGVTRLPNHTWIVVHILVSDTKRLYSGFHTSTFLHVRVKQGWRVARFLQGEVVSSLRPQRCEEISWLRSCYASSALVIVTEDLCNGAIYRLPLAQQNRTFHRFVGRFPVFREGETIEFRKGKGWVDGKIMYVAHVVEENNILYGVWHRKTNENVCLFAMRKPRPKKKKGAPGLSRRVQNKAATQGRR